MATNAYRYQADDGSTYQVVLPSDLADQLNYILADGTEPYLPAYISPRAAQYFSGAGLTVLSAIICQPFTPALPPRTVTVGELVYGLKSQAGESRNTNIFGNISVIAGPQGPTGATGPAGPTGPTGPAGPAGPSGVISSASGNLSVDVSISANTQTTLFSLGALAAGTYILLVSATFQSPSAIETGSIFLVTGAGITASGQTAATNTVGGSNFETQFPINALIVSNGAGTATVSVAGEFNAGVTAKAAPLYGSGHGCGYVLLKIA